MVELAIVLPLLCVMLLGAVDFARVLSAKQHLSHAVHVASLRLLTAPGLGANPALTTLVQSRSGLEPGAVAAAVAYSLGGDGSNMAIVTASYTYTMIMPGLQALRTGALSDGHLHVTTQATSVAATSAPTISAMTVSTGTLLTVSPPVDATVPVGLRLICTLYQNGHAIASAVCSSLLPLVSVAPTGAYTATVSQINAVTSPASSVRNVP